MRFVDLKERCVESQFIGVDSRLAYHDHTITRKKRVYEGLPKEHAICHVQNPGPLLATNILESDGIAYLITQEGPYFCSDSTGNRGRGYTSGLRTCDGHPVACPAGLMQVLR